MRFIIEHATRGSFVGFDYTRQNGNWKPHFRWSISRTDPAVMWWPDRATAERELGKVRKHAPKAYIVPLSGRK